MYGVRAAVSSLLGHPLFLGMIGLSLISWWGSTYDWEQLAVSVLSNTATREEKPTGHFQETLPVPVINSKEDFPLEQSFGDTLHSTLV